MHCRSSKQRRAAVHRRKVTDCMQFHDGAWWLSGLFLLVLRISQSRLSGQGWRAALNQDAAVLP